MAGNVFRGLLRGVCIVSLGCLFIACATTRGAGAERAETIANKVETVKGVIRSSNLSDDQKRAAEEVLDSIAIDSRELGRDVDHNKQIADDNAEAASRWRWLMGFLVVGVLVGGGFLIKKVLS